ncbi:grainyhead-like protein 2 homolog [Nematolebias whitei]|uniref:grainyhead-like protein 2 homolog n=1 Tax=Nematolebias whitei TaxID=451745 RepID=UPI001897370E|nr:grainyhead-like protein 2 homolog [Nematolebias whitei]
MDLDSKRLVVVVPNEVSAASRRVFSSEYETWYLENPLTAATKAMMSINGDEDSAAALGLLYDYYKIPRERKCTSGGAADTPAAAPHNYSSQDVLDPSCPVLRSMPVNLSLNNSVAAEHPSSRQGAAGLAGDPRGGGGKGGGSAPLALVKSEDQASVAVSCSGASYQEEPKGHLRMVYEQSRYDLGLSGYLKDEQSSTPDSTYEGSVEEEIYQRRSSSGADPFIYNLPVDGFKYSLEASMSLRLRQADGPMAYLNRGQFYALTLTEAGFSSSLCQRRDGEWLNGATLSQGHDGNSSSRAAGGSDLQQNSVVQSVIMVVFGEDKSRDEQLKNWKYWHSRQHTAKQRVLDIADYKESFSTIGNVEEIAYNAVSFTWDVSEGAKVFISVNCLSTDFSLQKGVKGMPLIIQIDTYSYNSCRSRPIHRAFSQIKVFCDKGAERKLRDEEKKQLRRRNKGKNSFLIRGKYIQGVPMKSLSQEDFCPPPPKKSKVEQERKVLLYVRKECDEVFDALMLRAPTLKALMEAISEKYMVPVETISKVYQKSKKGVLVNMDDNMVQHYSNEDTFILSLESSAESLRVTLSEI